MIGGDTNMVFNLSKASSQPCDHAKGTSLASKLHKVGVCKFGPQGTQKIRQSEVLFRVNYGSILIQFWISEQFWYLDHKLSFTHPN